MKNEKEYKINLSVGEVEEEKERHEKEIKIVKMGESEKQYSSDESFENEKDIKVVNRRRFSSLPRLLTSCFR